MSQSEIEALFEAIVRRDQLVVSRLLTATPSLLHQTWVEDRFFAEITHYAYGGDTPLHIAAAAYALEIARELLERGAGVRARNRRGAEPLHYAADGVPGAARWEPDAQASVIRALIAAGADPNASDQSGVRPLHRAVRTRCALAVRELLAHGADPFAPNRSGSTPRQLALRDTGRGGSGLPAARAEQAEIIRLLDTASAARPGL